MSAAGDRRATPEARLLRHGPGARSRLAAGIACGFGAAVVVIAQAWLVSVVGRRRSSSAGPASRPSRRSLITVALLALLRAPLLLAGDAFAQQASSRVRGGLRADLTGHLLALGPA